MKNQIIFYMHAGSGNHGCEAIVNSMCHMLKQKVLLISNDADEDNRYSLGELCEVRQERKFDSHRLAHVLYYAYRKITGDGESFIRYRYKAAFQAKNCSLAVSIGGDNYCYETMLQDLRLANNAFCAAGKTTVLLGCSIEPELLQRKEIMADLAKYHTIIARETITFQALREAFEQRRKATGCELPEILLCPDPAFILKRQKTVLPKNFVKGNTIGINLSPLIQESEGKAGITMESYCALIEHILDSTDAMIALIPHVVWDRNDDRKPLTILYEKYRDTGRVILVEDRSCTELKDLIADCRVFIGARTHATIAAYSTCVPTLVVGYSVKARGIARDLFGTHEHYVLPVQSLETAGDLVRAYEWLMAHEEEIRTKLKQVIPGYTERACKQGEEIERLQGEQ